MKKRLISMLLCILMIVPLCVQGASGGRKNPYALVRATAVDEMRCSDKNAKISNANSDMAFIEYTTSGDQLIFRGYDFNVAPNYIDIRFGLGTGYSRTINICVDSPTSDPIAVVNYSATGENWYTGEVIRAQIEKKITGVHDIYIVYTQGGANFFNFKFGYYQNTVSVKERPQYSDLRNTNYEKSVSLLTQLEILPVFPDDKFDLSMPVTRGEFASYIKNIMTTDKYTAESPTFIDVSSDNPYFEAVEYLCSNNIVKGNSGGTFDPYDFISLNDAETMILRLLGYEPIINEIGGTVAVCTKLGLLKNLETDSKVIRRSDLVTLLWNTLESDYLDIKGIRSNNIENYNIYEKKDGILNVTRNIDKGTGIVSKNIYTGLYSPSDEAGDGKVVIDDVSYNTDESDIGDYIGYECDYFYYDNDDTYTILAFEPSTRVKTITLSTYDENLDILSFTAKKIEYIQNSKKRNVNINSNAAFIFNGKAVDFDIDRFFSKNDFSGSITLIDNGSGYDCVKIDFYQNIMIESISSYYETVLADKISGEKFDLSDSKIVFDNPKTAAELAEIKRGSNCVIRISRNSNGSKLCHIYVVDNIVEGVAEATTDEKVTIDGKEYVYAKELTDRPILRNPSKFYINPYNEVVRIAANDGSSILYGCILGSLIDSGLDGKLKVRLIDQNGTVQIYECKNKLTLDGVKKTNPTTAYVTLGAIQPKTAIRYMLNSNNEVTMIDTPQIGEGGDFDKIRLLTKIDNESYNYVNTTNMITNNGSNMYYVDQGGYLFSCSSDISNTSDVGTIRMSDVGFIEKIRWTLYGISDKENYVSAAVLDNSIDGAIYGQTMIFDRIAKILKDEVVKDFICGYYPNGNYIEYELSDDVTTADREALNAMKPGDFIKVKLYNNKFVTAEYLYFHYDCEGFRRGNKSSTINDTTYSYGNGNQDYRTAIGYVVGFSEDYPSVAKISLGTEDGEYEYLSLDGVNVTIIDPDARETIITGFSAEDVKVGDFILYNIDLKKVSQFIVYR